MFTQKLRYIYLVPQNLPLIVGLHWEITKLRAFRGSSENYSFNVEFYLKDALGLFNFTVGEGVWQLLEC